MAERFCPYCRTFRADFGFVKVRHPVNGSSRHMCPPCQEIRKKPREELEALAKRDSDERNKRCLKSSS